MRKPSGEHPAAFVINVRTVGCELANGIQIIRYFRKRSFEYETDANLKGRAKSKD